jgi:hypothetical protein
MIAHGQQWASVSNCDSCTREPSCVPPALQETSLTIDGIVYVIDPGFAKQVSGYSVPTVPTSANMAL